MIPENDTSGPTAIPDREELDEQIACFECGALIAAPSPRLPVAEGIVLCDECCGETRDVTTVRSPSLAPWFEDLTGARHHT